VGGEEQPADAFRQRRPPGFPGLDHLQPARTQEISDKRQVGALAHAFGALQGDETAPVIGHQGVTPRHRLR